MGVTCVKTPEDDILYVIYTPTKYFEVKKDVIVNEKAHALGYIL